MSWFTCPRHRSNCPDECTYADMVAEDVFDGGRWLR